MIVCFLEGTALIAFFYAFLALKQFLHKVFHKPKKNDLCFPYILNSVEMIF